MFSLTLISFSYHSPYFVARSFVVALSVLNLLVFDNPSWNYAGGMDLGVPCVPLHSVSSRWVGRATLQVALLRPI